MSERTATIKATFKVLGEIFYRHWGTKALAFILAAILFVVTRDDVTRTFEVPLRVKDDPERVLMTEIPETVQVQVRGPWTRINRLQDYDFGEAHIDLATVDEGSLDIDSAAIVMPSGVMLGGIQYDRVDLRFDDVIDRFVDVRAPVTGDPSPDYELARVEVRPNRWRIRGGETAVRKVQLLEAEPLDVADANDDVTGRRAILPPPPGVRLESAAEGIAVTVRAVINPRQEDREYLVPVIVPDGLDPMGAIQRTYSVAVEGPMPDFRLLDELGVAYPVEARAERADARPDGSGVAEVSFSWAASVPPRIRTRLTIDHAVERVQLPAPPPPPPPPTEPEILEEEPS